MEEMYRVGGVTGVVAFSDFEMFRRFTSSRPEAVNHDGFSDVSAIGALHRAPCVLQDSVEWFEQTVGTQ